MNFHISDPRCAGNPDFGIEKVRAGIRILYSGVNHLDGNPLRRAKIQLGIQPVFPCIV
jgi:hypothetical protein